MIKQNIATFLIIGLLLLGTNVYAQKHTTIVYRYNQDSIKNNSYKFGLLKIFETHAFGESYTYKEKVISFEKKKDYSETICDYTINDTTCAFIFEGLGHQTFAIPGDTMIMNIGNKIPSDAGKPYIIPWFRYLTYEGKNKYVYSLFDSLSYLTGEMRFNQLFYNSTDQLAEFCKSAQNKYDQQIGFLNQYCIRHSVGKKYKDLANSEIFAAYISNLLIPLANYDAISINNYPKPYKDIILKCRFNDPSIYFKTFVYSNSAYSFATLVLPKTRTSNLFTDRDLIINYKSIKSNYSDSIRNHLLINHLSFYLSNRKLLYPSIDSLLTDFKKICKNHVYTHFLDSMNVARKALGVKKYSLREAMSSLITDTKGQQIIIKQLFKSKPLLIICWASWCAPCIREIPGEIKMQKLYGDKVDFVYLSFDRSNKLWQDKLKTLSIKDGNNYILTDYFNSNFAHFYDIGAIPYYLLYDKTGNRVEIKDLRPSNEGFKDILEKLIQ